MPNRLTYLIASILLLGAFLLCFLSLKNDAWTFDETAHIAAGYSYLSQQDYRLNPEHPPLIKDVAAFPLLFSDINFPEDHSSWVQQGDPVWWLQFDFATQFLYQAGNDPDQILLLSRTMMILVFLILAWLIFYWNKKLFGNKTAVLSLFLVTLSPTFLAHGRLVTTDVAAALGVVLATYFWFRFLNKPSKKNIIIASLAFGISLLFKFSLLLLIPFFGIISIIYALIFKRPLLKYIGLSSLVGIIALIFVIWPIYQAHNFNYPTEQQLKDTEYRLEGMAFPDQIKDGLMWMSSKPVLRSLAHYFTGVAMVLGRTAGGNTTFFMGQISAEAWTSYFPLVYLIKVPLSFHILSLIALFWFLKRSFKSKFKNLITRKSLKKHFPELAMFIFLLIYWIVSIRGNLNIGIRHLLPVFPFTIILVSRSVTLWLKRPFLKIKYAFLAFLLVWQVTSVVLVYPHFLAYFNQIIGGPENGYKYVTDSNLDWGQDLRRLTDFVEDKNIDKIYLDYFGGGAPEYYLGEKYRNWDAKANPENLPRNSWLAVSVNELQGGRAEPAEGFDGETGYYNWLENKKPTAKIGYSIFVYHLE